MGRYDSEIAWITGGGSGIGKALALELAATGADVAVSGRRAERLDEVVREIERLGRRGLAVPLDVTDEDAVADAADEVAAQLGGITVTVANAGYAVAGSIAELDAALWRRQLDVNVVGAAMTLKHALPYVRKAKGRLAVVGSVAAYMGLAGNGAYCASKAAVRALGQTLSIELAGTGVSCTTIHPGFVESEIAQVDNEGEHHADRVDKRPSKLMWTAEDAAQSMAKAIHRRKREHVFTGHGKVGAFLGQHFPALSVYAQARGRKSRNRKKLAR